MKNAILAVLAAVSLIAFGSQANAGQLLSGWPDAIKCNVTTPNDGEAVFYLNYINHPVSTFNGYRRSNPNTFYDLQFNQDGTFNSYNGGLSASNCNKSITQLYTDGQAIDFDGLPSGAVILFNASSCPAGWTRQLQVAGSGNDFDGVTCSKN